VSAFWGFMFKKMGLHLEIRDEHLLNADKSYVLCCNHQSMLDLIPVMRILPDRCTILAKKELLLAGTFGVAAWLCGIVFVDRLNPQSARQTMQKIVEAIVNDKLKLFIFPEGTRYLSDDMLPFKKGAFHLAIQAGIPIVPVVISSYQNFLSYEEKLFENGRVIVQCLPEIPTTGMTTDDVGKLLEQTQTVMGDCFKKLTAEVLASDGKVVDRLSEKIKST